MKRVQFETSIEKIGRILASQYGIEVVFEGNQACTDGKKIYLPNFDELSEELQADINGFLDHEVGHCKFTEFPQIKKCKSRFHKELLNAVEDTRIEAEMIKELPGTELNLGPLNKKYRGKMEAAWDKIPAAQRIIVGVRDLMEGKEPRRDADIKDYLEAVEAKAKALDGLNSTEALRKATSEIAELIVNTRKKKKEKEDKEKKEENKKKKGEEKKDGKKKEGKSGKEKDGKGKGEGKDGESGKGKDSKDPGEGSGDLDQMLKEGAEEKKAGKSEYDKNVTDVHSLIKKEIEKHIKETGKVWSNKPATSRSRFRLSQDMNSKPHVASTTRFDKVTDYSAKGDVSRYGKFRAEVKPLVGKIKRELERTLKVQENARWRNDRERGSIDARALGRLASNPAFRTPFKEYSKTQTNNVAVQLLIDQSGSMYGKIDTAKMAAIAMGEAMKELNIPFEITGFYSEGYGPMARQSGTLGDLDRFNRTVERLKLNVFKNFKCSRLDGIEKIYVGVQNCDGESLRWAASRLVDQKQKRKILIVFSDGMPNTGDGDHRVLNNDLKKSVEQIKKSGVEVIGIGIETEAVRTFYPEYVVLNDVKDLPKQAMNKLAGLLIRKAA
jgi:cobaltochelatase CobT